jgi:hypothetical protein
MTRKWRFRDRPRRAREQLQSLFTHLHQTFSENLDDLGVLTQFAGHLKALQFDVIRGSGNMATPEKP